MTPHSDRIRLVHITTVPQSYAFIRGQVGYLTERGFEVHAASSPGEYALFFAEKEPGAILHEVEMPRQITPLRDLVAVYHLWRLLREIRPHIVHAHTPKGGLLGMIAAWLARAPLRIYHIRGLPFMTATGLRRTLLKGTERVSCLLAHQVLSVSHSMRTVAIENGLCPERKVKVLLGGSGNGVDACGRFNPDHLDPSARSTVRTRYDIPDDAVVIGYLGRIVRDKGLIELIEAWNALREEFPRLHLLVMGDFEPQDPVPVEVERIMREDPRIHLTGFTHDTSSHYAAMDIMTLPSYREGFPNTPLEGASMGLPVVSTRVPGCIDAVEDGVTGLLVPPQDSGALRDAFRAYLTDPDLRMRHGRAGRDRVMREFRHELIREALYKEYLLLLKSRHIPIHASSADP